jgi:type II secretory pathway pseudopilin PulG
MNTQTGTRNRGFTLLDALIALAVLAFGLLAIAKLHSDLLYNAGVSKARTEAVQLAETRIEEMRNLVQRIQYDQLLLPANHIDAPDAVLPDTVPGINATFTRQPTISLENPARLRLEVNVAWTDARDRPQNVVVSSDISWVAPIASLQSGAAGGGGSQGIRPPTGNARFGYPDEQAFDPGDNDVQEIENIIPGTQLNDGTKMLIKGTEAQLVTEDGEVLLVMEDTSTAGQGFSVISGKVFFDPTTISVPGSFGTGQNDINLPDVHLIPSDTSVCTRVFANNVVDPGTGQLSGSLSPVGDALFAEDNYRFFYYQCYTGEAWYGNVGVVRLDSAPLNHRLCVGDPDVTLLTGQTEDMFWHIPKLASVRKYRGYNCLVEDADGGCIQYESVGIGVDPTINGDFVLNAETGQAGEYTATTLINQYFLMSRLTGQPTNASCKTAMEHYATTSFGGNSGEYFCLSGACPGGRAPEVEFTLIAGGATGLVTGSEYLEDLTIYDIIVEADSSTSDLVLLDDCEYTQASASYSCTIPRPGWTGFGNWSGEFDIPAGCEVETMGGAATVYTQSNVLPLRGPVVMQNVPIGLEGLILDLELNCDLGGDSPEPNGESS